MVRIQWNPAQVDLRGFREDMATVARLVKQDNIRLVLIDMNELPNLGLDEQFWLATHWLPWLASGDLEQAALVLPAANLYNQLAAEGIIRAGRHLIRFDIHFFNSPVDALDWLVGEDPSRLIPLTAEWTELLTAPRAVV